MAKRQKFGVYSCASEYKIKDDFYEVHRGHSTIPERSRAVRYTDGVGGTQWYRGEGVRVSPYRDHGSTLMQSRLVQEETGHPMLENPHFDEDAPEPEANKVSPTTRRNTGPYTAQPEQPCPCEQTANSYMNLNIPQALRVQTSHSDTAHSSSTFPGGNTRRVSFDPAGGSNNLPLSPMVSSPQLAHQPIREPSLNKTGSKTGNSSQSPNSNTTRRVAFEKPAKKDTRTFSEACRRQYGWRGFK